MKTPKDKRGMHVDLRLAGREDLRRIASRVRIVAESLEALPGAYPESLSPVAEDLVKIAEELLSFK